MIFVFLCLTYSIQYDNLWVHLCCYKWFCFIIFMAEQYSIVYMYHIFIHSSVDGHLGYFHILAIVNSTAMISGFTCLLELWLSQGICPVVGLLGHMVDLFLVFKGVSILFSIVAVSVYIPTNSIGGFPFIHILSSIYCV